MPKIKIELWKGKKYVVAREENGRIISRAKHSKTFNLRKANEIYRQNKSLDPELNRYVGKNVTAITDYNIKRAKKSVGKDKNYQYIVLANYKGQQIVGGSKIYNTLMLKDIARDEAFKHFYELIDGVDRGFTRGEYGDEDSGKLAVERMNIPIREGIRYYV